MREWLMGCPRRECSLPQVGDQQAPFPFPIDGHHDFTVKGCGADRETRRATDRLSPLVRMVSNPRSGGPQRTPTFPIERDRCSSSACPSSQSSCRPSSWLSCVGNRSGAGCLIPTGPSCTTCAGPARNGARSMVRSRCYLLTAPHQNVTVYRVTLNQMDCNDAGSA